MAATIITGRVLLYAFVFFCDNLLGIIVYFSSKLIAYFCYLFCNKLKTISFPSYVVSYHLK